jgi:leucyl-tRNA synthetase
VTEGAFQMARGNAERAAAALEAAARAEEKIAGYLDGATVRRVVAVPGRLVNFVLG